MGLFDKLFSSVAAKVAEKKPSLFKLLFDEPDKFKLEANVEGDEINIKLKKKPDEPEYVELNEPDEYLEDDVDSGFDGDSELESTDPDATEETKLIPSKTRALTFVKTGVQIGLVIGCIFVPPVFTAKLCDAVFGMIFKK